MSHFTVIITGENIEGQLEPFDENTEVEPYKRYVDLDNWWFLQSNEGMDRTDLVALVEAYNTQYQEDDDFGVEIDDNGIFELSTYNPDSKWDWYSVGGRWTGYFTLKPGATGVTGEPGLMTAPSTDPNKADSARKGDIDLEGMRHTAATEAAVLYDKFLEIVERHGPLPSDEWRKMLDQVDKQEFARLKDEYWDHPTIKALKDENLLGMLSMPNDVFGVDRDEFIENARLAAVPGYAMLHNGEWIEPGRMGWFGMSSDTPGSKLDYYKRTNEILDSLSDDVRLTIVDCHI